jgi:proline iminopeptidase
VEECVVNVTIRAAVTVLAAALVGLLIALTMPHGPATAIQTLGVMVTSLAVGLLAGFLLRHRWAMPLAPAAYIVAVELARLNAVGPTVDAIRLDNTIDVNGSQQALMIRGYDVNKPILLYLSGGPGQSSLPWPRILFDDLSRDFILVGWDQRGTGKSYVALDPAETLTPAQMVADTIEVTNYLRQRFDEDKIYLLGGSWGTTLAVLAAQQRPNLYHAIIGSGQMVSQSETDRRLYQDVLAYAVRTGNEALAAQMRAFGEPPYADLYAYAFVMGQYEKLYKPYTPPQTFLDKGRTTSLGPWNVLGSEYNFVEKVNVFRGFLDTAAILYPQLQSIDFRQDVPRLHVPLYVLDGAAELDARRDLALEWFAQVDAPIKRLFTFDNAAHAPAFEHFEAFTDIMTETILPETYAE